MNGVFLDLLYFWPILQFKHVATLNVSFTILVASLPLLAISTSFGGPTLGGYYRMNLNKWVCDYKRWRARLPFKVPKASLGYTSYQRMSEQWSSRNADCSLPSSGGYPKLWYPKTALTPRFREPFAPFRAPAESGHGIMIRFSCAISSQRFTVFTGWLYLNIFLI